MFLQNRINENGQHIKERWLIFTIICGVYPIISDILIVLFTSIENFPVLFVIFLNEIIFVLLYYFAYRKPGTRLLTFITFIKLLGSVSMAGFLAHNIDIPEPRPLSYCLYTTDFFFIIGWLFLSFQLRRINIREQPLYRTLYHLRKIDS